ncbi:hypothetical protein TNCV_2417131 [Trichonephila clavipes]|nr:hypothetical protein TNCV_2417131 [Trichonephila clavipes]
MPLSRMLNSTFAMPNIIDSHDMGLRTVLQSRRPKVNAYTTPIHDGVQQKEINLGEHREFSGTPRAVADVRLGLVYGGAMCEVEMHTWPCAKITRRTGFRERNTNWSN